MHAWIKICMTWAAISRVCYAKHKPTSANKAFFMFCLPPSADIALLDHRLSTSAGPPPAAGWGLDSASPMRWRKINSIDSDVFHKCNVRLCKSVGLWGQGSKG